MSTVSSDSARSTDRRSIPKNVDVQLAETKIRLFGLNSKWTAEPDELGEFPTNGDRWAAQEVKKRMDTEGFTRKGFTCQAIAAWWHHKSASQLRELGDFVGRNRILVIHGTEDRMITVPHAHIIIADLQGEGLTSRIFEGRGHLLPIEERKEFKAMLEAFIERTEKLDR